MSSFRLVGLPAEQFSNLFPLSAEQLAPLGIMRVTADSKPGFPCRVSLQDAEPGDELLLLPFEHQPACSPYRASGPIFVRVGSNQAKLRRDEIPPYVGSRLMSVRAYDVHHLMVAAEVCSGAEVSAQIQRQFSDPAVSYIHLHNAKRGCFSCRVERVPDVD